MDAVKNVELSGFDTRELRSLVTKLNEIVTSLNANATSITNLNAWATVLATKLNADAGVTDTNYDTNPQA